MYGQIISTLKFFDGKVIYPGIVVKMEKHPSGYHFVYKGRDVFVKEDDVTIIGETSKDAAIFEIENKQQYEEMIQKFHRCIFWKNKKGEFVFWNTINMFRPVSDCDEKQLLYANWSYNYCKQEKINYILVEPCTIKDEDLGFTYNVTCCETDATGKVHFSRYKSTLIAEDLFESLVHPF